MFKVADKMAGVCLWVGPTREHSSTRLEDREGMYARPPGRNRSKSSQLKM